MKNIAIYTGFLFWGFGSVLSPRTTASSQNTTKSTMPKDMKRGSMSLIDKIKKFRVFKVIWKYVYFIKKCLEMDLNH